MRKGARFHCSALAANIFWEVWKWIRNLLSVSNITLMLFCVALVFFMQGGFAMVETGHTARKTPAKSSEKLMDSVRTAASGSLGYSLCWYSVGGFIAIRKPPSAVSDEL